MGQQARGPRTSCSRDSDCPRLERSWLRRALRRAGALSRRHVSALATALAARSGPCCSSRSDPRPGALDAHGPGRRSAGRRSSRARMAVPVPRRGGVCGGRCAPLHGTRSLPWPSGRAGARGRGLPRGRRDRGRRQRRRALPAAGSGQRGGPRVRDRRAIAAARWLRRTSGTDHAVVGDLGSELVFGTYGEQQPLSGGPVPFVAETPGRMERGLERLGASYVVIDRRITLLPPRFGYYFAPRSSRAATVRPAVPARTARQAQPRQDAQPDLRQRQHRRLRSCRARSSPRGSLMAVARQIMTRGRRTATTASRSWRASAATAIVLASLAGLPLEALRLPAGLIVGLFAPGYLLLRASGRPRLGACCGSSCPCR